MSGNTAYSPARDLTDRQTVPGPGIPALLLFIACNHKGSRVGAQMRGRLPMRCAACVQKGKA